MCKIQAFQLKIIFALRCLSTQDNCSEQKCSSKVIFDQCLKKEASNLSFFQRPLELEDFLIK